MSKIRIEKANFYGACGIHVKAGANNLNLGDAGHGDRTYLELQSDGLDWWVEIEDNEGNTYRKINPNGIKLIFSGQGERDVFLKALGWAIQKIKTGKEPKDGEEAVELKAAYQLEKR